jgi:hypothetical protein
VVVLFGRRKVKITQRRTESPSFTSVHVSPELLLPAGYFPPLKMFGHHLEVRDFQPFEQLSSTIDPASHLQNMLMS